MKGFLMELQSDVTDAETAGGEGASLFPRDLCLYLRRQLTKEQHLRAYT